MKTLLQARDILRFAEGQLREILETALQEKRYADLVAVSSIAEALAQITIRFADVEVHNEPDVPRARSETSAKLTYPHFRRDGDKLVKVGWSKKDKSSYEHRAPIETVFQLASVLTDRVAANSAFKMEDFVPLRVGRNKELPTYQTYLALAWFRSLGIVKEIGRAGYSFRPGALDKSHLHTYWANLETSSH